MSRIRSQDTRPELRIRRALHRIGYRYRLHNAALPGRPDLVFPGRRKVLFVNGCFWHSHPGCREGRIPGSNRDYWEPKLRRNVERQASAVSALRDQGWSALVIWECEIENSLEAIRDEVCEFLDQP